jgi:hypothetical protein
MQRTNPDIDIILDILKAMLQIRPDSVFINSLHQQYCERGSLSKKQLEGLHSIASKESVIPSGKLATLQAIIMKKPTKYRSVLPKDIQKAGKNEIAGEMIEQVLSKYPQHKRVLFFKARYENNDILLPSEIAELEKFYKLLTQRSGTS